MKKNLLLIAILIVIGMASCGNSSKPSAKGKEYTADSLAIAKCLHGFFAWYETNQERISKIEYVDGKTGHFVLDQEKLKQYLNEIKLSGFVSDELVEKETKYYIACSKLWEQNEKDSVPPTGIDIPDRFYCMFDFIAPFETAPVTAEIADNRAKATLSLIYSGEGDSYTEKKFFDLKKEDGKWLISSLYCGMEVE